MQVEAEIGVEYGDDFWFGLGSGGEVVGWGRGGGKVGEGEGCVVEAEIEQGGGKADVEVVVLQIRCQWGDK